MIARTIGIVICRVGAALLLIRAVESIAFAVTSFKASGVSLTEFIHYAGLMSVPQVIGALALWVFAERVVPGESNQAEENSSISDEIVVARSAIVSAGTYLLGIYFLVFGAVNAIQIVVKGSYPLLMLSTLEPKDIVGPDTVAILLAEAVQVLIGIGLMVIGHRSR